MTTAAAAPRAPHRSLEEGGGWLATIKGVMFDPVEYFKCVPQDGPLGPALRFGIACHSLALAIFFLCFAVFFGGFIAFITRLDAKAAADAPPVWLFPLIFGVGALFSPLFALINIAVNSALDHLALLLVAGGGRGYGATLRATAYAQAPLALGVIPLLGLQVGQLWSLVARVIALSRLHGVSTGRAIATVVLPILVVPCLFLALYFIFVLVVVGAVGSSHGG